MFHEPTHVEQIAGNNIPQDFELFANYPNPFNSSTTISYSITKTVYSNTKLILYNVLGEIVREYKNLPTGAGTHQIAWDGQDENGRSVVSGLYFYRLRANNKLKIKKMLFCK